MKSPAYQWYPDKALADTRRLSWKAKGIYRELLDVMWMQFQETCSIPDDNKVIAAELGCSLEDWLEAKIEIMWDYRPLFDLKDGRFISNGLLKEKLKQAAHRQKQAENGRRGGRPKLTENKEKKAVGFSWLTQTKAKKSLSSPSPSPSLKKETTGKPPASPVPPAGAGKKFLSVEDLKEDGVDTKHASDWFQVRKAKRAPLTLTAWEAIKREAVLARVSPAQAVKLAAESGWQGFKAEWVQGKSIHQEKPKCVHIWQYEKNKIRAWKCCSKCNRIEEVPREEIQPDSHDPPPTPQEQAAMRRELKPEERL